MFMTPTAAMADIVFPAASYLEFDGVQSTPMGTIAQCQRKVAQIGECRSDHEIINELAKALGLEKYFWEKIDDFWDTVLAPVGLTFNEFKNKGRFAGEEKTKLYKQYEDNGFRTPSGKVELYSELLASLGFDPMPQYREPPESPYSDPALVREYPLQCTTWKLGVFRHSGGRQIPSLRRSHPDPLVIIHPETARQHGIEDGEWIFIETKRGKIKQKAKVSACVDQRIIVIDHAWWFPEKRAQELFGWAQSNYNVLTNDNPPFNEELGSFSVRGLACKIYRVS
jgi:anaerobic selenocysteine-containing dehydrogenase